MLDRHAALSCLTMVCSAIVFIHRSLHLGEEMRDCSYAVDSCMGCTAL